MFLDLMREAIVNISSSVFGPDSGLHLFIASHALLVAILLFTIPLIIIGIVFVFFDLLVDIWKIPFAAAVDVLKYLGFESTQFAIAALLAGPAVFLVLLMGKNRALAIVCAVLSALWTATYLLFPQPFIAGLAAIVPFNTILMTIACVLD